MSNQPLASSDVRFRRSLLLASNVMKLLRASFVGMKVRHFAQTFAALGGLLTIVNPVFAQTWTRTSAPSNNWVSVAVSADGIKLLAAAGSRAGPFWGSSPGPIYTSADSGATWTLTSAPTQSWSSVACSADGTKAAAVGNGGIFTSTNSGATWTLTSAPNTNYWSAVASSADGSKLVAVGAGVYTSTNSGDTWIQTRAPNSWNSVASSADGTRLVIVGCGGIYTSMDSGGNWSATDASNQCWVAVASSVDGTKLVAASQWMTYLSSDAGAHWISNGAPNWYSTCVASSADGKNLVVAGLDWVHEPCVTSFTLSRQPQPFLDCALHEFRVAGKLRLDHNQLDGRADESIAQSNEPAE